jgi:UDP-N-acetylglucosamine acyltransferase
MISGNVATPHGINAEGLRRRGFTPSQISNLRRAYKILYRSGLRLEEAIERIGAMVAGAPEVSALVEFLSMDSARSLVR